MSNLQLAIQFFLQLAVILMFCRVVGMVAARLGQPQVVAEMIAGVLLGPSLLGTVAPEWSAQLFPKESMKVLFPVSQLGLALYMFIVGLEFRRRGWWLPLCWAACWGGI
jgi:Kef-type K+ transport system membrane component KefB